MPWFQAAAPLVPDLIEQNGRWLGAQPALVEGGTVLSWAEFADATAQVARALGSLGIGPHDRVALLIDTRLETVLAMWGIVRAGAVAVPLNVSITDTAVGAMCADAACVAVFASGAHCERIDALRRSGALEARHFVACERSHPGWHDLQQLMRAEPTAAPDVRVHPDDECNIIYSSGTTALPKGIVHTHACRMNWAHDAALALRYHAGCRTLFSLGLFSNITWVTMLATMLVGGTSVLLRTFSAHLALALIESERITHGAFVPLQIERLLACPERSEYSSGSLRTLMCCGSALRPQTKRAFPREFGCELIELYGLTEGLITVLQPEDLERKLHSVGKPLFGSDIRILGADDREVPAQHTGEIVGRGRLVMAGYHASQRANEEATWVDPSGGQWLRTGDIGRLDEDGFLYLVDRKKDMIISGGQNIYPCDIETVMRTHPGVADVAVIGVPSDAWGETPMAVVVLQPGTTLAAPELIKWTNERLGKQQRVSTVVWVESLPRNANGKVLKRELRRQYGNIVAGGGHS